jgi:hypothetical protein
MDPLQPTLLSQAEFDKYAAAWVRFLDRAARHPERLQALFTNPGADGLPPGYQANVTFDVATAITQLVSTVGIAGVMASFVLLPKKDCEGLPRFRVVLAAVDALGGRISAYFLGAATWYAPPKSYGESAGDTHPHLRAATAGPVPYNLIRGWVLDWAAAALAQRLDPAMFATHYGPLLGYRFELSDFLNPLFTAGTFGGKLLQVNLGLKSYYPAYPDSPPRLAQTVGLVVRLYTGPEPADPVTVPDDKDGGGEGGGPSYDMGVSSPPG